jgi:hypothetical protein
VRMRHGEVVGDVESVPPRGEEVVTVVRSRCCARSNRGGSRSHQIGAAGAVKRML